MDTVAVIFFVVSLCLDRYVTSEEFGASMTGHFKNTHQQSQKPCRVCPRDGACVPKVQCPAHVRSSSDVQECYLIKKQIGVCCYTGQRHDNDHDRMVFERTSGVDEEDMKVASKTSKRKLNRWLDRTRSVLDQPESTVDANHPSYGHHLSQLNYDNTTLSLGIGALRNIYAAAELTSRQAVLVEQLSLDITDHTYSPYCPETTSCLYDKSPYRTPNGACNNEHHPSWGAANTAYRRLLPPAYDDGIWSMRRGVSGNELNSPRVASIVAFSDRPRQSHVLNLMFMQFGQFIAHDLTSTVLFTIGNNSAISCCTESGDDELAPRRRHGACAPIPVYVSDPFYSTYGQRCINFVRALPAPSSDCRIGYANPMNGATHFLDLSHVYGNTLARMSELRGQHGELKVFDDYDRTLLPLTTREECLNMHNGSVCFDTGDHHGNQIISLTILHTLFLREHNRIAAALRDHNPLWDDDRLFLQARRVVQAEFQHIVYNEWLPLLLGSTVMDVFDLKPTRAGYGRGYDPDANPSITAEFAAAAMRFGHSIVDGKIMAMRHSKKDMMEAVRIPNVMFQPDRLRIRNYMDAMLVGLTRETIQEADMHIDETLTNYLFHGFKPFGLDLAAINIQRGRDFGIRPYNDYRHLIGLQPHRNFDHYPPGLERLQFAYDDVADVDLFVGGLTEEHMDGCALGPTFANIIADQFARLKKGDRYFYELGPDVNPGAFTLDQLNEIKKVTMSRIVCDNSDQIEILAHPLQAFLSSDVMWNSVALCKGDENLPRMDLSKFTGFI